MFLAAKTFSVHRRVRNYYTKRTLNLTLNREKISAAGRRMDDRGTVPAKGQISGYVGHRGQEKTGIRRLGIALGSGGTCFGEMRALSRNTLRRGRLLLEPALLVDSAVHVAHEYRTGLKPRHRDDALFRVDAFLPLKLEVPSTNRECSGEATPSVGEMAMFFARKCLRTDSPISLRTSCRRWSALFASAARDDMKSRSGMTRLFPSGAGKPFVTAWVSVLQASFTSMA